MKTLSDIRSEYPQYEDLSDKELADKLHARFYSDMDRAEFDSKVGLSAKETPSDLSAIPRGFMSSGAGLLNLAGPGVKALYSGLVGDEEAKKEALGRFAARQQEIEAKYPQTPLSAVLEDPLGKLPSYLGEAVGGTISTAPALLGGGVGGLLGGAIAKRVAADQAKKIALRSALAGSAATALPLETAESYTETKGEALGPSVLAGGFKTGL